MRKKPGYSAILFAILWLAGCATTGNSISDPSLTICTDRSPVCTQNYTPVCGKSSEHGWKTYANACNACADATVEGHKPGECS